MTSDAQHDTSSPSALIQNGGRHQIDRDSVIHALDRRAKIDQARADFIDRERTVARVSGLDPATIQRLGGI